MFVFKSIMFRPLLDVLIDFCGFLIFAGNRRHIRSGDQIRFFFSKASLGSFGIG